MGSEMCIRDRFYVEVLEIRAREIESPAAVEAAVTELRALEAQAFDMLVNERLAADESFRIFMDLLDETVRELRGYSG